MLEILTLFIDFLLFLWLARYGYLFLRLCFGHLIIDFLLLFLWLDGLFLGLLWLVEDIGIGPNVDRLLLRLDRILTL